MLAAPERILDVPSQFSINDITIHLDANAEKLGEYIVDSVFWLAALSIAVSALRSVGVGLAKRHIIGPIDI